VAVVSYVRGAGNSPVALYTRRMDPQPPTREPPNLVIANAGIGGRASRLVQPLPGHRVDQLAGISC
jgi:hypothetical protein